MQTRKLRLNLDELSVESFVPAHHEVLRGTVHGAEATADGQTLCANTQCDPSFCVALSCDWTECANISCMDDGQCGSGGNTAGQHTCQVICHTDPGID
jgi:hypothetical protein